MDDCLVAHVGWKSESPEPGGPSGSSDDRRQSMVEMGMPSIVNPRHVGLIGGIWWLSEKLVE